MRYLPMSEILASAMERMCFASAIAPKRTNIQPRNDSGNEIVGPIISRISDRRVV